MALGQCDQRLVLFAATAHRKPTHCKPVRQRHAKYSRAVSLAKARNRKINLLRLPRGVRLSPSLHETNAFRVCGTYPRQTHQADERAGNCIAPLARLQRGATALDLSGEAALSTRRFTSAGFPINLGEDQPLFRTNCRISAGASGWRYHRHTPNVRRGYAHYWIDVRGRTQNTIRSGQLVSEKLVGWVGCAIAGLDRRVAPAPLVW